MPAPINGGKVQPISFKEKMEDAYLTYSMSVIVGRALPDVRDGLKPVQRRILYGMEETGNTADKPYRKSAKTVGAVLGQYHPHGDASVYDTMVRLAQDWVMRYPLIDGQGNFGSVDGDTAAAMRYTEARLSKIAGELLRDIEKDTVNWSDNYDNSEKEPDVLPSRFPNLLVNGSTGIAVGMSTNMAPHNLSESVDGIFKMLDNPDVTNEELMEIIKAPDFPTGALILGTDGARKAYTTGKGSVTMRAKTHIEALSNGKNRIVVSELPYNVNKARLIERLAELHRDKKVEGITALRDESDRTGMRLVIELRRDVSPRTTLNNLFDHSDLQCNFSINNLALVNGKPVLLTLRDMIRHYIAHQVEVIVRRAKFEKSKAEARAHIVAGLLKALDVIDDVINIIRSSPTTDEAKNRLMARFGFTEIQAQHILDMQLRRLTALERERLQDEHNELMARIEYLTMLISSDVEQKAVLRRELDDIRKKYGDPRRSKITNDDGSFSEEDLIAEEDVVITITHAGYIKRVPAKTFRSQRRGGRGIQGAKAKADDFVQNVFTTTTHHDLLFFTDRGRMFRVKAHEVPEASRQARGEAMINLLNLQPAAEVREQEKVITVFPVHKNADRSKSYLFFGTKAGTVKKTLFSDYDNVNASGMIAIKLEDGDSLVGVKLTNGNCELIMVSTDANALRFHEEEVRPIGRDTRGVRGIKLNPDCSVISMDVVDADADLLVVTSKGVGKRTSISEYSNFSRGSKGVATLKLDGERHGRIVAAMTVHEGKDLMLVSTNGITIRMPVKAVNQLGRATKGTNLMNLDEADQVAAVALVVATTGDDDADPDETAADVDE